MKPINLSNLGISFDNHFYSDICFKSANSVSGDIRWTKIWDTVRAPGDRISEHLRDEITISKE